MTLSADEIRALIHKIVSDSELQTEFRRAILPDDEYNLLKLVRELTVNVAGLSVTVEELARAQNRTEQRVEELAEAQKRTEQRVEELIEAQKRTEQRVEELAEAQRRTEERVGRLEIAMAELAEAQRRTEERVEELANAQKRTEERLGQVEIAIITLTEAQKQTWSKLANLDERIGVSTEQEAADMFGYVLRQKGYEILSGPFNLHVNGEIDVLYSIQDAEGRKLTAVLEAKTRLGCSAIDRWVKAMRSIEFRQRLAEKGYLGPYIVYAYGMRADPSAYDAAKKFGIGLITDRGEQVEPAGEFSD